MHLFIENGFFATLYHPGQNIPDAKFESRIIDKSQRERLEELVKEINERSHDNQWK